MKLYSIQRKAWYWNCSKASKIKIKHITKPKQRRLQCTLREYEYKGKRRFDISCRSGIEFSNSKANRITQERYVGSRTNKEKSTSEVTKQATTARPWWPEGMYLSAKGGPRLRQRWRVLQSSLQHLQSAAAAASSSQQMETRSWGKRRWPKTGKGEGKEGRGTWRSVKYAVLKGFDKWQWSQYISVKQQK